MKKVCIKKSIYAISIKLTALILIPVYSRDKGKETHIYP